MKQISNKEYERYQQYLIDKIYGWILIPDGLRFICASFDYDPEQIGKHMLEMLIKFRNEGIIEWNVLYYGYNDKRFLLCYLTTEKARKNIAEFDKWLPSYSWVPAIKKIDYLLWSRREEDFE